MEKYTTSISTLTRHYWNSLWPLWIEPLPATDLTIKGWSLALNTITRMSQSPVHISVVFVISSWQGGLNIFQFSHKTCVEVNWWPLTQFWYSVVLSVCCTCNCSVMTALNRDSQLLLSYPVTVHLLLLSNYWVIVQFQFENMEQDCDIDTKLLS